MTTSIHDSNHVHLGDCVWALPETDVRTFAIIILVCTALMGFYIAYKSSKPNAYRAKVIIVFSVPLILSTTYVSNGWDFPSDYKTMVTHGFIILQSILYWRATKNDM